MPTLGINQGIVWEVVHAEVTVPSPSGSISYQGVELAFSVVPPTPSGSVSYQGVELAFSVVPPTPSGSVSYQGVELAFSVVPGTSLLYESMVEIAWMFDYSDWPPPKKTPRSCGVLINPDFSINTYGLRTLSCERIKAPGVEQVPFRLAHKDNMGLRRIVGVTPVKTATAHLFGEVLEIAWISSE